MALSRDRLTDFVSSVSAGSTVGLCTVASNKKVYVKSIIIHNNDYNDTAMAHVYYTPNGHGIERLIDCLWYQLLNQKLSILNLGIQSFYRQLEIS